VVEFEDLPTDGQAQSSAASRLFGREDGVQRSMNEISAMGAARSEASCVKSSNSISAGVSQRNTVAGILDLDRYDRIAAPQPLSRPGARIAFDVG
jgi:hypothetical protein